MKNLFLSILAILTLSLTSCKSDDDGSTESSIVGTWLNSSTFEGETDTETYVFNSDNTYKHTSNEVYDGETETSETEGTYKLEGDKLILKSVFSFITAEAQYTYKLNNNKLTITIVLEEEGTNITLATTYTRQ